jgi:hypothetical protein
VVVIPERPSLTREALGFLGRALWAGRHALAPTGLAVLALAVTAALHALAWWSALLLAPLAIAPPVWLGIVQRARPARASVLAWRIGLALVATLAGVWAALAAGFGPLAGPLPLVWLLGLILAQTAWLFVRNTR